MLPEIYLSEARLNSIATSTDFAATQLSILLADDTALPQDLASVAVSKCKAISDNCRHLNELLTLLTEYGHIRRL